MNTDNKKTVRKLINEDALYKISGGNDNDKDGFPGNFKCWYCGQTFYCETSKDVDKHCAHDCPAFH